MRSLPFLALLISACSAGAPDRANVKASDPVPAAASASNGAADSSLAPATPLASVSVRAAANPPPGGSAASAAANKASASTSAPARERVIPRADTAIVRGLYVLRWAAQSPKMMQRLIALADSTEINAFVIDIKDELGINYRSSDSLVRRSAGRAGAIPNLAPLLDTLEAHGILAIARIVVFKDSVTARLNPEWTIRKDDSTAWRDKEGLSWVNPYHPAVWDLNIRVAEEVARLGFDEIQWDYIRFPEPYKSLPPQVFPGSDGRSKTSALVGFLDLAHRRLEPLGARSTADVFGLVTTVNGALEVGQSWEPISPVVDVMLPMVYPSHYPRGAFGIARPNADPYGVVYAAISRAHERDLKLAIPGGHVRPWIQAFTLGAPAYGALEVRLQKQAIYDAGYDGWILWHPGSRYAPFETALERETVSRKKAWTPGTPPSPPEWGRIVADSAKAAVGTDSSRKPAPPPGR